MENEQKSVVDSLDGSDIQLYPFLPYLLQDLWEIGSDPAAMIQLLKRNIDTRNLNVLDAGCGKGAVSIPMAREISCRVVGIDAMPEFINEAVQYAEKYGVSELCRFEVGDIRRMIRRLKEFDVVVLGAIGPVLGNLYETLTVLKDSLNRPGYVLLDDGYKEDEADTDYSRCLAKSEFYAQIKAAGYHIIDEIPVERNAMEMSDQSMYDAIKKRACELIEQHPDKKELFQGYLRSQEYENNMLENKLTCGTWLLSVSAP